MIHQEDIARYMTGEGLVIGARANWNTFPITEKTRFVDVEDIASIRSQHPKYRSASLAPIDYIDRPGTLSAIDDSSVDFVVDWAALIDCKQVSQRLKASARVMRPDAILILPAYAGQIAANDDANDGVWAGLSQIACDLKLSDRADSDATLQRSFGWFVSVVSTLVTQVETRLDLQQITRHEFLNIAVFRRCDGMHSNMPTLITCDGCTYFLHSGTVRLISDMSSLHASERSRFPSLKMQRHNLEQYEIGPPAKVEDLNVRVENWN